MDNEKEFKVPSVEMIVSKREKIFIPFTPGSARTNDFGDDIVKNQTLQSNRYRLGGDRLHTRLQYFLLVEISYWQRLCGKGLWAEIGSFTGIPRFLDKEGVQRSSGHKKKNKSGNNIKTVDLINIK